MNFQDLQYHFETYGCHFDHIEDGRYTVTNCINGACCEIEQLDKYSDATLVHYFYETGIPATSVLRSQLIAYRKLRAELKESHRIPITSQDTFE